LGDGKAIVQVVLPHDWVTRINHLAIERGVNRSALIRAAIAASYFEPDIAGATDHQIATPQSDSQAHGEEEHQP
jgi:hypothetical protein